MKIIKLYITLLQYVLFTSYTYGQITDNYIQIRVKNDDAGEISNWLNTGDDFGETQSLQLSAGLLKKDSIYNYRIEIESTEYSALNIITPEPRDILFSELNNLQISIDNNKYESNSFFYSFGLGLYHIQGNKITIGATGQKYYWHKWIVNKFYSNKEFIYVPSHTRDSYIPYVEVKYGYNKLLFKKANSSLYTINNLECRVAGNFEFTGIGARSYFDLRITNDRFKMYAIDFEMESYYLTNVTQYQIAYIQTGIKFNFKHLAIYTQINKPLKKYLNNPYTKYDDMELQFKYGLLCIF